MVQYDDRISPRRIWGNTTTYDKKRRSYTDSIPGQRKRCVNGRKRYKTLKNDEYSVKNDGRFLAKTTVLETS